MTRGLSTLAIWGVVWIAAAAALAAPRPPSVDAGADGAPAPLAEPAGGAAPRDLPPPADTDRSVLQQLHAADQTQIQLGTLAKEKGSSKAVRELGRKLEGDHTAAEAKLDAYLRKHGTDVHTLATVTSADPDHELLVTKAGTAFDRAFGLQLIADHTKLLERLESARIETSDSTLRELYEQLIPMLEAHKRAAQAIVAASARS